MKILIFIAYLCGVFFVPLLPAFSLYKSLPSRTSVRGPFKGLKINLQGAFGGYFLLVLLAFSFAFFILTPSNPQCEVWKVTGMIQTKSTDPNTADVSADLVGTEIKEEPCAYLIDSEGKFEIMVTAMPDIEGTIKFPGLIFNRDGYTRWVLGLNTADRIVSEEAKTITLKHPIVLTKLKEEMVPIWNW
jgi:hypothetical protein